jgi:hypothetical protein
MEYDVLPAPAGGPSNIVPAIISRQEAFERGLSRYYTAKKCRYGHVVERRASDGHCIECTRLRSRSRRVANPEHEREQNRRWRARHPDRAREKNRRWLAKHPLYGIWAAMVRRCENPKVRGFRNYGSRGINVCQRWRRGEDGKTGYQCWLEDMGPRPSLHSLDRINNDGLYCKENCRWATASEQRHNQRLKSSWQAI